MEINIEDTALDGLDVSGNIVMTDRIYKQALATGIFATACMVFTTTYVATKGILMVGRFIQNR
jgi:hypothetical protein